MSDDIYTKYGFDKTLKRGVDMTNPYVSDYERTGVLNATNVNVDGSITAHTLSIGGGKEITISPGDNIQDALDQIHRAGGGVLRLSPGTYRVTQPLICYSSTSIYGTSLVSTIIDFGNTSANLLVAGGSVYTAGTISAVTSGVIVTGSGTSWLTNAKAGQFMFLGTRWYKIGTVSDDTTIILAEPYVDDLTMPGLTYRIATLTTDVYIERLTLQNSTGTALEVQDARFFYMKDLLLITSNKGMTHTNCSNVTVSVCTSVANTSSGFEFNNCGFYNVNGVGAIGNGGNGIVGNNCKTIPFNFCSATANTGDGWNLTDCNETSYQIDGRGNGVNGMRMVTGCNYNFVYGSEFSSNISGSGILLSTACIFNSIGPFTSKNNGVYGWYLASATCGTNHITAGIYYNNSSGSYSDSGTGTVIL